jgi:hypothetical protein
MSQKIEDYALIGDPRTAALVSVEGCHRLAELAQVRLSGRLRGTTAPQLSVQPAAVAPSFLVGGRCGSVQSHHSYRFY